MNKTLSWLPRLAVPLALAGCCANDTCACNDLLADALTLSFQLGGARGFAPSEIDTLFLVRLTPANPTTRTPARRDSVLRVLPLATLGNAASTSIVINNTTPFSASGGNKLGYYSYVIAAYQADRLAPSGRRRYAFTISNIQLDGRYQADGCCTCYENTKKQYRVSSYANAPASAFTFIDATAPVDQPRPAPLYKLP